MKRTWMSLVAGILLIGLASPVSAQANKAAGNPAQITYQLEPVPMPVQQPGQTVLPNATLPSTCCTPCPSKVCVPEVKKNTKTVYTTRCKDYCQTSCLDLWRRAFGRDCDCSNTCGEVKTKKVLVKKTVPDCDTTQCMVKELCPTKP